MRRLEYTLTRRQCWQVHADVWLAHWKILLGIHAVVALVIVLAWFVSGWFWLALFVPFFPPVDGFWRWIAGWILPLLCEPRIELEIGDDDLRFDVRGHGMESVPFSDIRSVQRIGNLWCLLFDRHNLEIPVELVDDDIIRRMRRRMMP
jgi:hypothetical protein